jgi:hypothetical protein
MTRISLISGEYCSLETPAKSAAPYPHQWHTKPNIFGLNLAALMCYPSFIAHLKTKAVRPLSEMLSHACDEAQGSGLKAKGV